MISIYACMVIATVAGVAGIVTGKPVNIVTGKQIGRAHV